MWALPELVEAAARIGDAELARDALERLAETTQPAGTDFALGIEARCRALLSDGAAADALYREAIDRLAVPRFVPSSPAHICSTGSGCAARAGASTRASTATAHDMLVAIGMERSPSAPAASCSQPARRCANAATKHAATHAAGSADRPARPRRLSNPEIGAQLFISSRTVEWHLRKVFTSSISSRKELREALPKHCGAAPKRLAQTRHPRGQDQGALKA